MLMALPLAACSQIGPGQQAVGKDSWGSPTVSECAKEESQVSEIGTDWYRFPARAITWDANSDPGAERTPYTALSKPASAAPVPGAVPDSNFSTGQAEMAIPVTLTFDMTTNCDELKEFFRQYATQDEGWLDEDGKVTPGWIKMLTRFISQPASQAVVSVTQQYPWQKIWNDENVRREYIKALSEQVPEESAKRTGGKAYFHNFQVIVGKPYPTSEDLRKNVDQIQTNQAAADAERIRLTAQANAQKEAAMAQQAAADAQRAAEVSKAAITAAKIAGFPDVESYLRDLCINTSGCTMYNPPPLWVPGTR